MCISFGVEGISWMPLDFNLGIIDITIVNRLNFLDQLAMFDCETYLEHDLTLRTCFVTEK